jgi:hypothetical protein
MSAPRTKRQFAGAASDPAQRRITSFFNTNGGSSPASGSPADADSPSHGGLTAADSTVQANLLSVGMRVRKAVPEGYKTGNHYSAFSLWSESNNSNNNNNSYTKPTKTTTAAYSRDATGRTRSASSTASAAPRELLPFCGIHKVGGLGTQGSGAAAASSSSAWEPTLHPSAFDDAEDDVPGLTMSQESADSSFDADVDAAAARTRKRFFADEDDDADDEDDEDNEDRSRSLEQASWGNGRVFAVPRKGRLQGRKNHLGASTALGGQENVMVVDGDFEEAAFLDPNFEVEMGDA